MSAQTPPTTEQVLTMMRAKMGETLPDWPQHLQDLAPDLLVATAANSASSVGREASTIPAKYRSLIAVAAALGRGQAACARSQAYMARSLGATLEEVVDTVRIARHLAAAGILDAATPLLADLTERG
ncbi:MAG: carboxymuconolactone decarboxylase family protein [Acidobacteria bacterium]|nr:carboxymuconolactone decarboxylase family protein [Acidobacteriota bacterium]